MTGVSMLQAQEKVASFDVNIVDHGRSFRATIFQSSAGENNFFGLKLKRVPRDTWSVKEQLCLASAVLRSGDQNWMSVSRSLKPFGESSRPADWFSQKSCARQYGSLLENIETPKRKKRTDKRGDEHKEMPSESIVKNLTLERINELKRILKEEKETYLKLKEEVKLIRAGEVDEHLIDMCQQIEQEKKQKEKEAETHAQWLQDRQKKELELERLWRFPAPSALTKESHRGLSVNHGNRSQSESGSETESAVESPLRDQLFVDTSILQSDITLVHHSPNTRSPTFGSLLNSSPSIPLLTTALPGFEKLVTNIIPPTIIEESPKPVPSSPTAEAMMQELNDFAEEERYVPIRKLRDVIKVNQPYKIQGVKTVKTKFGERAVLTLQELQVFVPERLNRMFTA